MRQASWARLDTASAAASGAIVGVSRDCYLFLVASPTGIPPVQPAHCENSHSRVTSSRLLTAHNLSVQEERYGQEDPQMPEV